MGKEYFSRARYIRQAENLNGRGGICLLHPSSLVVNHGSYLAVTCACGNKVSDMQCTLLNQNGRNGSASLIQLRLDDKSSRTALRVCLELKNIRCQQDCLQKVLNAFAGLRGHRYKLRASAPVCGDQFIFRQLLLYALNVCRGLINLVHSDNDLDACSLCMVDCLDRLRHHAVIRSDNKDRNIRRVRTTHTHCRERLVSGRIQEGDPSALHVYSIRTYVLCDTSRLAVGHICLSDRIQQGRLTMVNMTHDTDNGRSFHQILLVLLVLLQELLDHIDLDFLLAEDVIFHRNVFSVLVGDFLVHRNNLPLKEQLLHNR